MRLRPTLAALLLAAAPGVAIAQAAVPKPPSATLTKEQIEDAAFQMRVLVSALQSDKVDEPSKEALTQCMFNNAFSKISEAMNKVIVENTGKVDKRNPDQMLFVMVRVCGYTPQPAAKPGAAPALAPKPATPAAAKPAPAKPAAKAPQGR